MFIRTCNEKEKSLNTEMKEYKKLILNSTQEKVYYA